MVQTRLMAVGKFALKKTSFMERGVASEGSDLGGLGIAPREFEVDHMDFAPHLKKKRNIVQILFRF